jgi:signal transduction protein with GAF and PtsI domain
VSTLPEDKCEAFLSVPMMCRDKLVGVINVQHRRPKSHSRQEIRLISVIGFSVAAEVELVRIEAEIAGFSDRRHKSTDEARTS